MRRNSVCDLYPVFGNANWSPFYNVDNVDFALLNKLLQIPELRQRYLAHFRTILNNSFDEAYITSLIDQYANIIDSYVYNDPHKIYTYNEFQNEVENLKDYFINRSNYLLQNNEVSQTGSDILLVECYVGNSLFAQPTSSDEVVVNVELDSDFNVNDSVNLYYGVGLTGRFERVVMNYDFTSESYTYTIPSQNSGQYVRFYIETITNDSVRVYSPQGAEHNVYVYQVKMDDLSYIDSDIVINELMASNDLVAADEMGEFDDWIEIYNNGSESVNLEGLHLSDDILELDKYTFPYLVLNPDSYAIVWADDDEEEQSNMHATFKLSASGEQVYLSDSNGNILDEVIFGEQQTDMGYARVPNGVGEFLIQNPTFSANNDFPSTLIDGSFLEKKLLIKSFDLLGRNNNISSDHSFLLKVYNDGSVVKELRLNNLK